MSPWMSPDGKCICQKDVRQIFPSLADDGVLVRRLVISWAGENQHCSVVPSTDLDGLVTIEIINIFPPIPSLVGNDQLPCLPIDKVTVVVCMPKTPDFDRRRHPARLLLEVRDEGRLHAPRVLHMLRVVGFWGGRRAVVGEHDDAALRLVPGDGVDLSVKPGQVSAVGGIVSVDGPAGDVGEVLDEQ